MSLRIANGAGFLGDWIDAPRRLLDRAEVDYLTLEYLAELTLSILARAREKNPQAGYAEDFLDVLRSLTPHLESRREWKLVTNGGGMNPPSCARAAAKILDDAGLGDTPIGVVTGDDLLPRWPELISRLDFHDADSGEPFPAASQLVSANAYLGAQPIAEALAAGARIVITGRVADASLTVGPAMHEFGGDWTDWDRLAGYSVAGHLIECGAQSTGGYSIDWSQYELSDVGYPIAELEADGSCILTKPNGSGGAVTRRTVVEQLVYEIGDPKHYLTPDVDCDFTTADVEDLGNDRVAVRGATGRSAPANYKVSAAFRDGFQAAGTLLVHGPDCEAKARAAAKIVLDRLRMADCFPARHEVELLGGMSDGSAAKELMLRIAVHDPRREAVERFTREIAPLITSGPAGLAGYAAGRPSVRPVYAYRPTFIPRELLTPQVEVRPAREWLSS